MSFPRFRIWMLMVAVAAVGVTLAAVRLGQYRARYRALAAASARNEAALNRQAEQFEKQQYWATWEAAAQYPLATPDEPWHRLATESRVSAWHLRRMAAREARLKLKYERAAGRPWLPAEPEPQ